MGGELFPSTAFNLQPVWSNFLANPGLVQFNHRLVGYLLFVLGLIAWLRSRSSALDSIRGAFAAMMAMLVVQVVLGVLTVMHGAPLPLAIVHQLGAVALFTLVVRARFARSTRGAADRAGLMQLRFTIAEMHAYMAEVFPELGTRFEVLEMAPYHLKARMALTAADLRPGGTVSGPAIFALADCAYYMATLAMIGRQALAVTTSASIDYLRKPGLAPLVAEARVLKLGRRLSVGDVLIFSEGVDGPVARAGLTYSIPPAAGT